MIQNNFVIYPKHALLRGQFIVYRYTYMFSKKKKKKIERSRAIFFPPKKYKFINMNILPNISKKNLKTFGGDIDPPKPSNIKRKRATQEFYFTH